MKNILKLALILMFITLIAAVGLALVNLKTKPIIEAYKLWQQEQARKEVIPVAEEGVFILKDSEAEFPYYIAYVDPDTTRLVGYTFLAKGKGYSSTIETVVGVDTAGMVTGIKITFQQETPGLGARATEVKYGDEKPWFPLQFAGKLARNLAVDKDGGEIQSITGATITSRVVTNSINEGMKKLQEKLSFR